MFKRFLVGFSVGLLVLFLGIAFLVSIMSMFAFPELWYVYGMIAVVAMGSSWGLCAAFFPTLLSTRRHE